MSDHKPQTKMVPPLPYLAAAVAGWWLDRHVLALSLKLGDLRWPIATLFIVSGVGLMVWAALTMWRWRTTINPFSAVSSLCRDGPFRFSRNPIYLGDILALIGAAVCLDSLWVLLFTPFVWSVIRNMVIRHEEAYLEALFGDTYRDYRTQVRRWL